MVLAKNPYGKCDKTFCKRVLPFCIIISAFTKNRRFHNTIPLYGSGPILISRQHEL